MSDKRRAAARAGWETRRARAERKAMLRELRADAARRGWETRRAKALLSDIAYELDEFGPGALDFDFEEPSEDEVFEDEQTVIVEDPIVKTKGKKKR